MFLYVVRLCDPVCTCVVRFCAAGGAQGVITVPRASLTHTEKFNEAADFLLSRKEVFFFFNVYFSIIDECVYTCVRFTVLVSVILFVLFCVLPRFIFPRATDERRKFPTAALTLSPAHLVGSSGRPLGVRRKEVAAM